MENKQTEKSQAELYREERKKRMAKAAKKNEKKSPQAAKIGRVFGKVVGIVIVVAVCLGLLYGCLSFFGVPQKVMTAAKVGDERISVAKYDYYYMATYLRVYNTASQYESYGSGYGLMYTGYDCTKAPEDQKYTLETLEGYEDPTWADYFKESALKNAQSYVAYADLAREAGMTLTEDEKAEIDKQVESLAESAKEQDYSLNRFLTKNYGKGASEKLFREVMEESYLAYNYANQKQEEIIDSVTDEQINEEFSKNIQNYTKFSISLFTVKAETAELAENATDEEKAAAKATAMQTAKTTADSLAASVNSADTLLASAKKYNSDLTAEKVAYTDTAASAITTSFGQAVTDWVYSADRAAGDKTVIEVADGYVVAYLTSLPARDTTKSVDVRHILIKFPTDSEGNTISLTDDQKQEYYDKAQSVYNEYLANPTEENFISLAGTYNEDDGSKENGGLYEKVTKGQMVTEFNDWIFDAARKSGDTGIVGTQYGYHIMYYVNNDNEEAWAASCRTTVASASMETFQTDTVEGETYALNKRMSIVNWAARDLEKIIDQSIVNRNLSASNY